MANNKDKQTKPQINNFVAKNAQSTTGAGAHEPKQGKKASRARQKKDWKNNMSFIRELNNAANLAAGDKQKLVENVGSLSSSEISRLVRYVADELKAGGTDAEEIAYMALENIAGMDDADDATIDKIVKQVADAASKQKG